MGNHIEPVCREPIVLLALNRALCGGRLLLSGGTLTCHWHGTLTVTPNAPDLFIDFDLHRYAVQSPSVI